MIPGIIMNTLLIALIVLFAVLLVYIKWLDYRRPPIGVNITAGQYTIENMTEFVKETLHELTHSQLTDLGLHEEEYKRRLNKRSELRKALKDCISGDLSEKQYVKQFMADLLVKSFGLTAENIDEAIPFDEIVRLTPQDQFEIIFYLYQIQYGQEALSRILESYGLAEPRILNGYGEYPVYAVTGEDIEMIFMAEYTGLTFSEKLDIVVQRIYQQYKGFSVVDDLRDQRIDGISGGVNGILTDDGVLDTYGSNGFHLYLQDEVEDHKPFAATESVWVFYKGKSIHMGFLSFGSELELKRVCQNIYKYNHPGQLSESNGYKVNEMKDGSRVVVVRPPFAESWAFFVRKFDIPNASLQQLITGENAELPIELLAYLMKGSRITAITGAQGSGKTTLLMAMVEHIDPTYTLRVQEMAFELHLRKIYSRRNILSFRETDRISGQEGLDLQKKTDGTVNILGEVASDEVAAWMIQMSQVASLFTVFTHHAKTFRDLVFSLRNSLLKIGVFHNEHIAEEQVIQVINFDIHMKRDADGKRYIERITECIPMESHSPLEEPILHKDSTMKQMLGQLLELQYENRRQAHRRTFTSRNIVEYKNGKYIAGDPISEENIQEMAEQMGAEDASMFRDFLNDHWGGVHVY
ncbi:Flp pilus assembly complex ATPase component TadA [Paenibacillus sp. KQZ6P-2]|uniref:Flp pilus assembly complex ATPase component TadA n=1 Tax=Paenibacillus mangrovi TaxID=2931978 RepID=A0A9X1WRD1_9BACL|nr:ATPase, T2SS/T4P/T4SS family [Paenibacillus mangrovi]MCJ8012535.1 Flp pilus assembly complex ATPase component TadA [Paenibacillus mangrovi]